ncbi:MAG TPA: NusG domain II-containing protein [Rhodocyclaceae bacterium]|nr:NusG domain II-containing protein [Rhodocyclaceae bacterium]
MRRALEWGRLLRPGDFVVLALALVFCVLATLALWRGGAPDKAVVRAAGRIVAEVPLSQARTLEVEGPLGVTLVEIEPGRARVASDPGARQYCVRQGWLTRAGAVAICAPNQVSLSLVGGTDDFDSLNY